MSHSQIHRSPRLRRRGFTLIELLVVVVIVILVSAVALPTVVSALTNRQVGEGARVLQAAFAGARDAAIRANAPRGFRLLPDPTIGSVNSAGRLAANRLVQIEPAPTLSDGYVTFPTGRASWIGPGNPPLPPVYPFPVRFDAAGNPLLPTSNVNGNYPLPLSPGVPDPVQTILGTDTNRHVLMVVEARATYNGAIQRYVPAPRVNWFWNVRIGDRIRLEDSGAYYTIVGPMTVFNPEKYVNIGPPGTPAVLSDTYFNGDETTVPVRPEFLFLVNGVDDNHDGYVDQGVDGVNQNLDYVPNTSPLFQITDDLREWVAPANAPWTSEREVWLNSALERDWDYAKRYPRDPTLPPNVAIGAQVRPRAYSYTIHRRPVVSPGAREVNLPAGAVIDLTTWNSTRERSRLPVDRYTGVVDVLIKPSGEIVPTTEYSSPSSFPMDDAFYHFWIADREDVVEPFNSGGYPNLPVPEGTAGYTRIPAVFLKKDRQLLTLTTRTGQVVTNSVEYFDVATPDPNLPYRDAQRGLREAK
ncbi:MAG: prepilin-type N-terminal cleavage/methylation domain-containing protein [Isosphaeraceae bacterium]